MYSKHILQTVSTFLDTHPEIEEAGITVKASEVVVGETPSTLMMNVDVDGELYLVVAKRVGG